MALQDVLARLPVRGEYLAQQQFDQQQQIAGLGQLLSIANARRQQEQLAMDQQMQPLRMEMLRAQIARQNEDMRLRGELDQRQKTALLDLEGFLKQKYPGTPQMDAADNVMGEQPAKEVALFKAAAALDPRNATDLALSLAGMKSSQGRGGGVDPMIQRLISVRDQYRREGRDADAESVQREIDRFENRLRLDEAKFQDASGVGPNRITPQPALPSAPRPVAAPVQAPAPQQTGVTQYTAQADSSLEGAMAATMDRLARVRSAGDQEGIARETQNVARLSALANGPKLAPKDVREIERDAIKTGNKEVFDSISKRYETLADAPNQIAMLNKARELIPQAAPFVGSFGEQKANIAQFFNNNFGTNIAAEQVANAGALRTALFTQIMDNLKKMDAQPSQLQQQIMMRALGDLNTDPGAMNKIVDIMDEVIRTKVDTHNKRIPEGLPRGEVFKIDLPAKGARPSRGLSPAEREELDALRRRFGRQQ